MFPRPRVFPAIARKEKLYAPLRSRCGIDFQSIGVNAEPKHRRDNNKGNVCSRRPRFARHEIKAERMKTDDKFHTDVVRRGGRCKMVIYLQCELIDLQSRLSASSAVLRTTSRPAFQFFAFFFLSPSFALSLSVPVAVGRL